MKIEVGDFVMLLVGSPTMIVSEVDKAGWIYCQWFAGQELCEGHFPRKCLAKIKKPKKSIVRLVVDNN